MARDKSIRGGALGLPNVGLTNGQPEPVSPVPPGSKLSVTPFAILLPPLTDLSSLRDMREFLEDRLQAVQSERDGLRNEDLDGKELLSEESMINQVLQWLTVSENQGE